MANAGRTLMVLVAVLMITAIAGGLMAHNAVRAASQQGSCCAADAAACPSAGMPAAQAGSAGGACLRDAASAAGGEVSAKTKAKAKMKTVYVCPMKEHPRQFSKPGKCPLCGMNLVKKQVPVKSAPAKKT